ncbi:MAG TPA: amino acid adenylation domain-containing protein [Thermoanaerobaculia bacterium]|nr:amino acid adenylation domain-containing protein [Thermoanaerobaculia bacterium]
MTEKNDRLSGLSDAKRALLEQLVAERRAAAGQVRRRPRPERVPLSFGQERLWVVEQLTPGTAAYNVPILSWLDGALDTEALDRAIDALVQRHESLRSSVHSEDGRPFQKIESVRLDVERRDAASDAEAIAIAREAAAKPFELERAPLFRAMRIRVRDDRHLLVLVAHHLMIDGWSIGVLLRELAHLYNGTPLATQTIDYADYAMWQREWADGERMQRQLAYWREHLDGCPSVLDIPADRARPPVQSFRGSVARHLIPAELYEAVEQYGRVENVTPFMTLFAAWNVLLHRWTGQSDLPVGVGLANRARAELESIAGFFVNTLVVRTNLDGQPSFRELVLRVRTAMLGAQANQDAPLSRVLESVKIERAASHMPLMQAMMFFQNYAQQPVAMNGLAVTRVPLSEVHQGAAQTDIALYVNQDARGELLFQYSTDLFDQETIDTLAGNLIVLLRAAIANPDTRIDQLPLLTEDEHALLAQWNDTHLPYASESPVIDLIRAQVDRTPDAIAVTFRDRSMTYAELLQRATALAGQLDAGPGDVVGLYLDRSMEMIIALVAAIQSGAAYVPLDPAFPADRLAFMREASGAKVVVTEDVVNGAAGFSPPAFGGLKPAAPHDLAYILFTSGSTGKPKGVEISQRSVVNLLTSVAREPGMTAADTILAVSTLSFDIALFELVLPLTVGARILLADRDTARDGAALAKLASRDDVTIMQATPATWRMLLDVGWRGKPSLKIITTGEACPRELADRLLPCCRELWNLYGPTETTVYSTLGPITGGTGPVSIGRPVANTRIDIVDRNFELLPPGVPGELLIGGDGVGRGYRGRPDLTEEKFITVRGERVYRTGDLARWRRDGTLEVLGRMDHQVKLRGFRIELGEIEAVLADHADVEQAVVHCREDRPGDKRLVAYTTGAAGFSPPNPDALRAHLRKSLPDYMIPAAFVVLDAFPLTPNGKVDRKALPAPEALTREETFEAPRDAEEVRMAALWSDVLGRLPIGRNENFFDLGGHSLLATQLLSRLESSFGVEVPLRVLFESPTVASLTLHVADARAALLHGENLDDLLTQLESLSDEEALAMRASME